MNCQEKQRAFSDAMQKVQSDLERELGEIASQAERKSTEVTNEFEQNNDLAEGVVAIAGTVIGGVAGGVGGAVAGSTIGKTIGSLLVLEITNREEVIAIDIPQITTENKEWIFKVPSVAIKNNDIVFTIPTLVMKRQEGPRIPHSTTRMVTTCKRIGIGRFSREVCTDVPQTTVTWEQTYIDVPTYENKEHRIVIGIPQVEMRTERIVVSIPAIKMHRQELKFYIPTITIRFIKDAGKRTANAIANIAMEASTASEQKKIAMKERIRTEVVLPATQMFECYKEEIKSKKTEIASMFDAEIQKLTDSLKTLLASGVPTTDNDYIIQKEQLDNMIKQRNKSLEEFDIALNKLEEESKKAINDLINFED